MSEAPLGKYGMLAYDGPEGWTADVARMGYTPSEARAIVWQFLAGYSHRTQQHLLVFRSTDSGPWVCMATADTREGLLAAAKPIIALEVSAGLLLPTN